MKKSILTSIVILTLLLMQQNAFGQNKNSESGLSTMIQIELIVLLIIIGLIFGALMFHSSETALTKDVLHVNVPTTVVVADVMTGKMLNLAIRTAFILLFVYLIVIISSLM